MPIIQGLNLSKPSKKKKKGLSMWELKHKIYFQGKKKFTEVVGSMSEESLGQDDDQPRSLKKEKKIHHTSYIEEEQEEDDWNTDKQYQQNYLESAAPGGGADEIVDACHSCSTSQGFLPSFVTVVPIFSSSLETFVRI